MAVYCNDLTWEESFSTANGKGYCDLQRQSPININTGDCVNSDTTLGSFTFNGYDEATTTLSAHNNGHEVYWGYVQTDTHFDHYPIALPTKMAVYCNDLTWE